MSQSESSPRHTWNIRRERIGQWTGHDMVETPLNLDRKCLLVGIVASHQARHPEWESEWRRRILAALKKVAENNGVVIYSLENTIGTWIKEFAGRLQVPSIQIATSASGMTTSAGIMLDGQSKPVQQLDRQLASMPLVDRMIFALADEIHAVSLRPRSKTEYLLTQWIDERRGKSAKLPLYLYGDCSKFPDIDELAGWIHVVNKEQELNARERSSKERIRPDEFRETLELEQCIGCVAPIIPFSKVISSRLNSEDYLVHCTRGRGGPLPLQSQDSYVDEIFLSNDCVNDTPLDNLLSILEQRRITATSFLKKNKTVSVSFSNVPLLELLSRRKFQSHLQRWEWEPYGLAIRKEVLAKDLAAEPVLYTDDVAAISDDKIWLTQPASESRSGRDWKAEKEWRVPSDIRLAKIGFTDAFVFVPTLNEAVLVSKVSPFPVAIVK